MTRDGGAAMPESSARWRVLALLFTVRCSFAFQFQAVGALSPLFVNTFGVSLADIGLLIGLYLAPGIAFALPGGALAARFGDRAIVLAGLALMVAGGGVTVLGTSFEAQIAGRLIAGVGGVIINVLMSKIVADWFAGREIATAMAIYVNSWPVGIAVALAVLPFIAEAGGLPAALGATTILAALGLLLMGALYRAPPREAGGPPVAAWPVGAELAALGAAAAIWALFNAAVAMVFGFGPALLTERGMTLVAASGTTSLVFWLVAVTVPLGGIIADRLGRRDLLIVAGLLGFVAGLVAVRTDAAPLAGILLIGVLGGLPAGPMMSLAAAALRPETRAAGMGLFYTLFYVVALAAPWLAGRLATAAGTAAAAFDMGVAMLLACVPLLMMFRAIVARGDATRERHTGRPAAHRSAK
jgi:MFS family permease